MHAKYIVFPKQGAVAVESEDVSADRLLPTESLLRTETSIISAGTELAGLHNTAGNTIYPMRPGYGCIGRVEAVGSAVKDFKPGERAFYAGRHASVQKFDGTQQHQWGALYRAPAELDPVQASFACITQIAMIAPHITEFTVGDTVAVFGLGLVGNLAAQLYKLSGARVIGLDPVKHRCDIARSVGIENVVDALPKDQPQAVRDLTGGKGAQVTVDAVGHSAVVISAVAATARFGQTILLGSPRAPFSVDITSTFDRIHQLGIVVRGAHMWRLPAREINEAPRSVAGFLENAFYLIESGKLKVSELLSHFVKPEGVPEAYIGLKSAPERYMGVVIDWRNER